jgi:hypothetical protein
MLELPFIVTLREALFAVQIIITVKAHDSCIFITNNTPWLAHLQSIYQEIITSLESDKLLGKIKEVSEL